MIQHRVTKQGVVCTPITPALGRLRQEDYEFEARLGYKASPFLKKKKKIQKEKKKKIKKREE